MDRKNKGNRNLHEDSDNVRNKQDDPVTDGQEYSQHRNNAHNKQDDPTINGQEHSRHRNSTQHKQEDASADDHSGCQDKLKTILAYLHACFLFPDTFNFYIDKYQLAQKKLANALHVDPSTISHWRKGRRLPQDSATIYQIAKAMGIHPSERQSLFLAWTVHRTLNDMIPYVDQMINDETLNHADLESIQKRLNAVLMVLDDNI